MRSSRDLRLNFNMASLPESSEDGVPKPDPRQLRSASGPSNFPLLGAGIKILISDVLGTICKSGVSKTQFQDANESRQPFPVLRSVSHDFGRRHPRNKGQYASPKWRSVNVPATRNDLPANSGALVVDVKTWKCKTCYRFSPPGLDSVLERPRRDGDSREASEVMPFWFATI
jgi:hypothetical protein